MSTSVAQIFSALAFDSSTRLYRLDAAGDLADLLVESWACRESLNEPWELELNTLGTNCDLDIHAMLGQKVTLRTVLADGSLHSRTGIITAAAIEDADGGFARYILTVRPWIALLAHTRQSRVWVEKPFTELIESVFTRYAANAQWRWADDISEHLARSPFSSTNTPSAHRSYTVQYRETDLDFLTRLLAEEGLVWRVEEDPAAPAGHTVVLLADTVRASSCPEDATSQSGVATGDGGIRFHRSSAVETSDAVQAWGGVRQFQPATTTVLAWDYAAKCAVAASVPTAQAFGGPNAPRLEQYRPAPAYSYATRAQADRAGVLAQEAIEARHKTWLGRSTVRTLRAGQRFRLSDSPLDVLGASPERSTFLAISVTSAGINNLPKDLSAHIAERGGTTGPELLPAWVDDAVRAQVAATGYANAFEAIRADVPWRPAPLPRPKAPGPLTATVVGADGSSTPTAGAEIHTDRLGRIRIRHDFQPEGEGSTWVRVMQPFAGAGMGLQFTPRIGQEVLLNFIDDDLERPFVVAALYTGRGEGGINPTPGGQTSSSNQSDPGVFAQSSDHRPSGQGNLTGGNSPAWHGAAAAAADIAAGGQNNAGALSGWKTKEFNGQGFNQLVFDDTPQQLRAQLATTQHATQLNLGHLIHQADNHRGSFRGLGFELRTDAYGTVRGAQGVLISSYGIQPSEPAGDNAAGMALASQFKNLSQTFSDAAKTHQTVQLASAIGSVKASQSALSDKEAPAQAMHTALKGMVSAASLEQAIADAAAKSTATQDKLPHTTDPVIAISAKAGLAIVAGQDVVMSAGEGITLGAGQDANLATGGAMRIHSGQAIGVLAGAIGAGTEASGKGITLIAGQGPIDVQAQAGTLQVAAKGDVSIQSKFAHINWAAAKSIKMVVGGGASLFIGGGGITAECPGTLTVKASVKSFQGPERVSYAMPALPQATCASCLLNAAAMASPFAVTT